MTSREEAQALGRMGERWVKEALERRGVAVLESNWRCAYGEIDLIAATGREILFVEVKTRRSDTYASAREAVDSRKQRKLLLAAQSYLLEHPQEERQPRFDVAEVYAPQGAATKAPRIYYYQNAFDGG